MNDLRSQIKSAIKTNTDDRAVGLADNGSRRFHCGNCEYFDKGTCHNDHPKLSGKSVKPQWCCNLYDHPGMKVIIR